MWKLELIAYIFKILRLARDKPLHGKAFAWFYAFPIEGCFVTCTLQNTARCRGSYEARLQELYTTLLPQGKQLFKKNLCLSITSS